MVNMALSCPSTHFRSEATIISFNPSWQKGSSPTSWNLSTKFIYYLRRTYLQRVLKTSKGEGGIIQISQKEKLF